ncbi:MAG TPA: hypothetical protein VIV60_31095 [Polyangiaceae bacterium]
MDPAIDRLVDPSTGGICRTGGAIASNYASDAYQACLPNNAAFHRLAAQYAFAFAPTAMHSARTTGVGVWHVAIEAAYTRIDSGADYWKQGSRGSATLAEGNSRNNNPAGALQLYSLKLRKGFGYGFEITGQAGFMPQTSLWNAGVDMRLSLFEGFRTGIPGYIPDVAVGGGVRTITGTRQFQLTVASVDVQVSKPIRAADALVVTPWLGFQELFAFIDSNVVDLTPSTNQERLCSPTGQAVPGQIVAQSRDEYTGAVMCAPTGSGADFSNNRAFKDALVLRQRLLFGANLRHEHLMFGLQFITDLTKPGAAQTSQPEKTELLAMPRQWMFVLDAGLMF